jgi:3-hydroxybutyryl-CoA dehydrogenase
MKQFSKIAVAGAGTMGHGIAQVCGLAGFPTVLVDNNSDALSGALGRIVDNLQKGVDRGKVTEADKKSAIDLIGGASKLSEVKDAELFIEAVPEIMDLKKSILREADSILPENAVLASNTSSLSISELADATNRPESVVGLHFFNPVHIMKLLEIVRGKDTNDATVEKAMRFGHAIGKTAVVVKDSPGFATSRLGICLGNEAMRMVEEGVATVDDIDKAMMLGYGHPVGPLQLTDMVGLDVRLSITKYLHQTLKSDAFAPPQVLLELVAAERLGKKSGVGFYTWDGGKVSGPADLSFVKSTAAKSD